jgi:hypothetical protein
VQAGALPICPLCVTDAQRLPVDANGRPTGDKTGFMGKRNRSGQWKVRWFVLKDKLLQYYKVHTEAYTHWRKHTQRRTASHLRDHTGTLITCVYGV